MSIVKKKHKFLKITIIFIITLIVLTTVFAVTCVALAVQDPYTEKYSTVDTVAVDSTLVADVAKAAAFGKEYIAQDEEINSYIRKVLNSSEESQLKDIAIYFHEDTPSEVYGRIHLNTNGIDKDFAFYSEAAFSIDQDNKILGIKLSNAKIGMLPIPEAIFADILQKSISDKVELDGTTIYMPIAFEGEVEGIDLHISLKEFTPKEQYVIIKSNKVLADTLDSATDKAKEWIAEHRDELSGYDEDIDNWINENKDKISEYESRAEEWVDENESTIYEYGNKVEDWVNENSEEVSKYTDMVREWFQGQTATNE